MLVVLDEQQFPPQALPRDLAVERVLVQGGGPDQSPEQRVNPQAPPDEKSNRLDAAKVLVLAKQQAGNQESAEDEEQVHPGPTAGAQYVLHSS